MEAKLREVLPGIHLLHLPLPMRPSIINVYLIDGGDEWALVDTGMNSADSAAALQAGLAATGCPVERVRKIVCTHHHPDHYGASQALKQLTRGALYLHRLEYERAQTFLLSGRPPEVERFFRVHGLPLHRFPNLPSLRDFWGALYVPAAPDVEFDDGDVISVGTRRLQVVWTPGHTPGHCVFYLAAERVLIVGDHLLPKITPHVGVGPTTSGDPLADFLASQEKVQRFDVDVVLPAHGAVFSDHRHRAQQIIQHHRARLQDILDIVRRGTHSAYEIARRAFSFDGDSPAAYQFPATFETLAHLVYLEHTARVRHTEYDGEVVWRAA